MNKKSIYVQKYHDIFVCATYENTINYLDFMWPELKGEKGEW